MAKKTSVSGSVSYLRQYGVEMVVVDDGDTTARGLITSPACGNHAHLSDEKTVPQLNILQYRLNHSCIPHLSSSSGASHDTRKSSFSNVSRYFPPTVKYLPNKNFWIFFEVGNFELILSSNLELMHWIDFYSGRIYLFCTFHFICSKTGLSFKCFS